MRQEILKNLNNVESLPTLPSLYFELNKIIDDNSQGLREVCDLVEKDQAVTSKILKLVNSAHFGLSNRIGSLKRAINLLGLNEVKNLVLGISVISTFSSIKKMEGFDPREFWKHSVSVGIAGRLLAKDLGPLKIKYNEEAFVCGLLHDIGKLVIYLQMEDDYLHALQKNNAKESWKLERETYGIDHLEAGWILADKWNLPSMIKESIKRHNTLFHDEKSYDIAQLCKLIHISDVLAHVTDISGKQCIPEVDIEVWNEFNMSQLQVDMYLETIMVESNDVLSILV